MSISDLNRPTHPELMSENELCQILKNSCIEIQNLEKLSKIELVEIYKRVAMPLPQRQRGDKKYTEENSESVNGNCGSEEYDKNIPLENSHSNESNNTSNTNLYEKRKRVHQEKPIEILKSFVDETKSVSKKMRLSTISKLETDYNGITKHMTNEKHEDSTLTPIKKRQKITWP